MEVEYPFDNIEAWLNAFRNRDENTIKEFFDFPLPVRFHLYWLLKMGTEESYIDAMERKYRYNYLPILQMLKERIPGEFYMYFHDLLTDEERPKYSVAFMKMLGIR